MKTKLVNENYKENYTDNLLINRGILADNLQKFYHPNVQLLQSPEAFKNIAQGLNLILKHISQQSNIAIVVDSDVDGFTSAAIIYQWQRTQLQALSYYLQPLSYV